MSNINEKCSQITLAKHFLWKLWKYSEKLATAPLYTLDLPLQLIGGVLYYMNYIVPDIYRKYRLADPNRNFNIRPILFYINYKKNPKFLYDIDIRSLSNLIDPIS